LQSIRDKLNEGLKIDETGIGNGTGTDADAKSGISTEFGKLDTSLSGVLDGSGAPNSAWGFGISFPSTCSAITIPTSNWGTFNLNFCQWQNVAHDIMALVWIGATLFFSLGMVGRTVSAG
jgi:hypothetical protein